MHDRVRAVCRIEEPASADVEQRKRHGVEIDRGTLAIGMNRGRHEPFVDEIIMHGLVDVVDGRDSQRLGAVEIEIAAHRRQVAERHAGAKQGLRTESPESGGAVRQLEPTAGKMVRGDGLVLGEDMEPLAGKRRALENRVANVHEQHVRILPAKVDEVAAIVEETLGEEVKRGLGDARLQGVGLGAEPEQPARAPERCEPAGQLQPVPGLAPPDKTTKVEFRRYDRRAGGIEVAIRNPPASHRRSPRGRLAADDAASCRRTEPPARGW